MCQVIHGYTVCIDWMRSDFKTTDGQPSFASCVVEKTSNRQTRYFIFPPHLTGASALLGENHLHHLPLTVRLLIGLREDKRTAAG